MELQDVDKIIDQTIYQAKKLGKIPEDFVMMYTSKEYLSDGIKNKIEQTSHKEPYTKEEYLCGHMAGFVIGYANALQDVARLSVTMGWDFKDGR